MKRTFTIVVDDDERAACPDTPWTACFYDENGDHLGEPAGVGATVSAAIIDFFKSPYISTAFEDEKVEVTMLYDVPLTGHIVVEANSPAQAIEVAQRLMDRSEGYIVVAGPVEVYVP